jgi:hypothetical protein
MATDAELARLARLLDEAKAELSAWQAEVDRINGMLLDKVAKGQPREVNDGDTTIRVTAVHGERVVTDPLKLRKKLNPEQWRMVTSTVLDNRKLEAAMTTGAVDPTLVASVSEVVASKPYIKVTRTKTRGARRRGSK